MTNDLFRDHLEKLMKEPVKRKPFKPGMYFAPIGTPLNIRTTPGWQYFAGLSAALAPLTVAAAHREEDRRAREHVMRQAGERIMDMAEAMGLIGNAARMASIPLHGFANAYQETTDDLREQALTAKQSRGTGPALDPLRVRGRNNHYRTKG